MLPRRLLLLVVLAAGWVLWLLVEPAAAVPAAPVVRELRQPDGHGFAGRQWGDEHAHGWETTDGYSVVRDHDSGFWEYGVPGAHGRLVASGRRPGQQPPPGPRHLRPQETSAASSGSPARAPAAGADSTYAMMATATPSYSATVTGHVGVERSLVLLVSFDDQRPSTSVADWAGRYFGTRNSVRDYFDQVSYGALTFAPAIESHRRGDGVVGWLNLGRRHPDFEHLPEDTRWVAQAQLTAAALRAANPYVRFGRYDRNDDGMLSKDELHITVIVAGREASFGGLNTDNVVWGHQADLFAVGAAVTLDGVVIGDGYTMFGERHGAHMATLGIMVHEMGHDIDWPDLYDVGDGGEGVGAWSIMASGAWLSAGGRPGSKPSHPDAFLKYYQGWIEPLLLRGSHTGVTLRRSSAPTAPTVVRLGRNPYGVDWRFLGYSGRGEYFLVENRQRSGYDAGLPGCGLLVWHVDETRTPSNFANAVDARKLVDLEEADGRNELDRDWVADSGDPYNGDVTGFSWSTYPDSDLYSGARSGAAVTRVQRRDCATPGPMTADFVGP